MLKANEKSISEAARLLDRWEYTLYVGKKLLLLYIFDTLPWEKVHTFNKANEVYGPLFRNSFSHWTYNYFWKIILFTNFR